MAVTRPQPQAGETAARLEAAGYRPVLAPLLVAEPLGAPSDAAGIGAIALTSRTGARRFAGCDPFFDLPVFAVGDATAAEARRVGFRHVVSADGNADDLVPLITANATGPVVHFCGEHHRGAIVERLQAAGLEASRRVTYRMAEAARLPGTAADIVLVYSPRAARVLERLSAGTHWAFRPAAALSPAVAAALSPQRTVTVAARPSETALLDALTAALRYSPSRSSE